MNQAKRRYQFILSLLLTLLGILIFSGTAFAETIDSESFVNGSFGSLGGSPYLETVNSKLDWSDYSSNVCWANGNWKGSGKNWTKTATKWNVEESGFSTSPDQAQYTNYALAINLSGEGRFSFDYDFHSDFYPSTSMKYMAGLMVIVDNKVAFLGEGKEAGTFSWVFNEDKEHEVVIIFNVYLYYDKTSPNIAKIENFRFDTEKVAEIPEQSKTFYSLQEAVNNISDDQKINLLTDVQENVILSPNKEYTIDLLEHSVDGNQSGNVFTVNNGTVTIKNGTIKNGKTGVYVSGGYTGTAKEVNLEDLSITENSSTGNGGAVFLGTGNLNIKNSEIYGNSAGQGSALYTDSMSSVVSLDHVDIYQNEVESSGIIRVVCTLTAEYCNLFENTGSQNDSESSTIYISGASRDRDFDHCLIYSNTNNENTVEINSSKTTTFNNSRIYDNEASLAGGIYNAGGKLCITDTVVTNNSSSSNELGSGGIYLINTDSTETFVMTGGAVYNNHCQTDANDFYIKYGKLNKVTLVLAKDMNDPENSINFSGYYWRDQNGELRERENPFMSSDKEDLLLTAFNSVVNYVASYQDEKFETLTEAVTKASNDPNKATPAVIVLIAGDDSENSNVDETHFTSDPVDITCPIEIRLNEKSVTVQRGTILFYIKESGSLKLSGKGDVDGKIYLTHDHSFSVGDDFESQKPLIFTFSADLLSKLKPSTQGVEDITFTLIENGKGKIDLSEIVLDNFLVPAFDLIEDGNDIVLFIPRLSQEVIEGIFINQNSKVQSEDGSFENPFKSFSKAKEEWIKNKNRNVYLIGTYSVTDEETWSGETSAPVTILRFSSSSNIAHTNMIKITENGKLTLENITLDGDSSDVTNSRYKYCGSMIKVDPKAELFINDGTILTNNNVATIPVEDGKRIEEQFGGAIFSEGDIVMNGGTIENCSALVGGGVALKDGTFTMNAGLIQNNMAVREAQVDGYENDGGGVALILNRAKMIMTGGTITGNQARSGAGISLGTSRFNEQDYEINEENLVLDSSRTRNSSSIEISDNHATDYGGGICIRSYYNAYVYDGILKQNTCGDSEDPENKAYFGGGAIYVDGGQSDWNGITARDGYLKIDNVLITRNQATVSGGAIAGCKTSNVKVYPYGSKIYANSSETYEMDDIAIQTVTEDEEGYDGIKENDLLSEFMLGGLAYQWKEVGTGHYVTEDYLNSNTGKHIYTDVVPSDPLDRVRVQITENTSETRGGAIGCNGDVEIGGDSDSDTFTVEKKWNDPLNYRDNLTGLNIWLFGKDDQNGIQFIKYQELYNGKNWKESVTFKSIEESGLTPIIIEEMILKDGTHIWSDDNLDEVTKEALTPIISELMNVQYGTSEFLWTSSDDSPFESFQEETESSIAISNGIKTGSISFTKLVDKVNDDIKTPDSFTFNIDLLDSKGEFIDGSYNYTVKNENQDDSTSKTGTISSTNHKVDLKADETVTITGVPIGTHYIITEEADPNNSFISVFDPDTQEGDITLETYKDTITFNVTNYIGYPVGQYPVSIKKTVTGDTDTVSRTFKFEISQNTDDPYQGTAALSNSLITVTTKTGSDTASFGDIIFKEAGIYQFTIREVQESIDGYTYDGSIYTLTLDVTSDPDDLRRLLIDWESENTSLIKKTGEDQTTVIELKDSIPVLEFTNIYKEDKEPGDPSVHKEEILINNDDVTQKVTGVDGHMTGPTVKVDDKITYRISWDNVDPKNDVITVIDRLDHGVDFVSASFGDTLLEGTGTKTEGDVTIQYNPYSESDPSSHSVIWTFKNGSSYTSGVVELTVKVNEDADLVWKYDPKDPSKGYDGTDKEETDHHIINKAIVIGDQTLITEDIKNLLEGLFIEKIHMTATKTQWNNNYHESLGDDGFLVPEMARDEKGDIGFTNKFSADTDENDYKVLLEHDTEDTIRYFVKITNNTGRDLKNVVIVDPINAEPIDKNGNIIAESQVTTSFPGIAGKGDDKPYVEGRSVSSVNNAPDQDNDGLSDSITKDTTVTYTLTAEWDESWGDSEVTIEDYIPDYFEFVSATYDPEGLNITLTPEGQVPESSSVILTYEPNKNIDSINDNNGRFSCTYHITGTDSHDKNQVQLTLRAKRDLDESELYNCGSTACRIVRKDRYEDRSMIAVYNKNDLGKNFLRWGITELPMDKSEIVYFDIKVPESIDQPELFWDNVAYVEEYDKLLDKLEIVADKNNSEEQHTVIDRARKEISGEKQTQSVENDPYQIISFAANDSEQRIDDTIFTPTDEHSNPFTVFDLDDITNSMMKSNKVVEHIVTEEEETPDEPEGDKKPNNPSNPDNPSDEVEKPTDTPDQNKPNTEDNDPKPSEDNPSTPSTSTPTTKNPTQTAMTTTTTVTQTGASPQTGIVGGVSISALITVASSAFYLDHHNRKKKRKVSKQEKDQ